MRQRERGNERERESEWVCVVVRGLDVPACAECKGGSSASNVTKLAGGDVGGKAEEDEKRELRGSPEDVVDCTLELSSGFAVATALEEKVSDGVIFETLAGAGAGALTVADAYTAAGRTSRWLALVVAHWESIVARAEPEENLGVAESA